VAFGIIGIREELALAGKALKEVIVVGRKQTIIVRSHPAPRCPVLANEASSVPGLAECEWVARLKSLTCKTFFKSVDVVAAGVKAREC
jgi:hypothetical protein